MNRRNENQTIFPILYPVAGKEGEEADGYVMFQKGKETQLRPVKRVLEVGQPSRRAQALIHMLLIATDKTQFQAHKPQLKINFRTLAEKTLGGTRLTDAVSELAMLPPDYWEKRGAPPDFWSRRWLPPLFNSEIEGTRIVMWWPEHPPKAQFGMAIYCQDRETARLVRLLFTGIKLCPGCGVPFTPKGKQLFHSANCAARYRMARWREDAKRRKS